MQKFFCDLKVFLIRYEKNIILCKFSQQHLGYIFITKPLQSQNRLK